MSDGHPHALRDPPALAQNQDGIVSRGQLLGLGWTPAHTKRDVGNGRWRALTRGVYATHTGPVQPVAQVWSALLYAGPGAVASHATALWLAGVLDEPTSPIHLGIPHSRRVRPQAGMRIHRMTVLDEAADRVVHPAARPPRLRIETAVLDQAAMGSAPAAVDLALRAIQRRLTTAARLQAALAARPRHRWRSLLTELLADAVSGVASPLELRYLRDVERRHRLPTGVRNAAERARSGEVRYRDVRYREYGVVVELDGLEAHPADTAFRDLRRDNEAVASGDAVLRYGWRDVFGASCHVAAQVAAVLQVNGWRGTPQPCGPACAIQRTS